MKTGKLLYRNSNIMLEKTEEKMQRNENKMPNGAKWLWPSSEKRDVWKMRLNSREMAGKKAEKK